MGAPYGYLLLVVVWFSWGLSYPATAIALRSFDVWTSRCIVTGLAGLVMLGAAAARGGSLRVPRSEWRDLFIAAIFNMSIFQISMTYGVALLSPGRTVVIIYTMPLWASLFAALILGERLTLPRLAALGLGLVALVILMDQDLSHLADAPLGAGLTLLAAMSFAFGTVWMKRRRWSIPPIVSGGWQLLIGVIPLSLIWIVLRPDVAWHAVSFESLVAVSWLTLVSNSLAYIAWFRVLAVFPATVSSIGTLAVPVIGVLSSVALVGDAIGPREMAALALVSLSLALVLSAPWWDRSAAPSRRPVDADQRAE